MQRNETNKDKNISKKLDNKNLVKILYYPFNGLPSVRWKEASEKEHSCYVHMYNGGSHKTDPW